MDRVTHFKDELFNNVLGECIPCFPDNRWRLGATCSELGIGIRKFVMAKKDFNIP